MKFSIPLAAANAASSAFVGRYGLTLRQHVIPRKTISPARERVWSAMGCFARAWSTKLTQPQRDRWTLAGSSAPSAPGLLNPAHSPASSCLRVLTAQRSCINEPALWEPPAPRSAGTARRRRTDHSQRPERRPPHGSRHRSPPQPRHGICPGPVQLRPEKAPQPSPTSACSRPRKTASPISLSYTPPNTASRNRTSASS